MSEDTTGSVVWADAMAAAALFAVDPVGLGGIRWRSGAGPVREAWTELLRELLPDETPVRRCPLHIADDRLLGGLDLAASLAAGRPIAQRGLLAEADGGVVFLPMAERLTDSTGAKIAVALDDGEVLVERDGMSVRSAARMGVIVFDEGVTPEERPPTALTERCAFSVEASAISVRDLALCAFDEEDVRAARKLLPRVGAPHAQFVEGICEAAEAFGVASARAPLFALRAARAAAALDGRDAISIDDVALAARLVLAPRALTPPTMEDETSSQPPPPEDEAEDQSADETTEGDHEPLSAPLEMLIAATQAALPPEVLARLAGGDRERCARASASGAGAQVASALRGRPIGSRSGALRSGERLNLVETLRAAAPWQKLRRKGLEPSTRIEVRKADFRIRRFVEQRESTTIFVVDASGSSAFQRLAEVKGAVELLLAEAYVTRARVALVAFRNASAEVLLPPTRSLARARRRLAELPGGGGTPLASGIEVAQLLALAEKAKGRTPLVLLLTDGRANIARDGSPGRARATEDAFSAAKLLRASGLSSIHIDTSPRTAPDGDRLARAMGATYAPLPYVDARSVLGIVQATPRAPQ